MSTQQQRGMSLRVKRAEDRAAHLGGLLAVAREGLRLACGALWANDANADARAAERALRNSNPDATAAEAADGEPV